VVQRKAEGYNTWPVYDTVLYDAYGMASGDFWTFGGFSPHRDPVGFGGQFGYFTEWETKPNTTADAGPSLLLLSHRYYDPATGRFVNRDPIGYDGGINLYGFAEGNPVNRIDPDGLDAFDDISDFFAGYGDTLSFGGSKIARKYIGIWSGIGDANEAVDYSSTTYLAGQVTGTVHGIVEGGVGIAGSVRAVRAVGGIQRLGRIAKTAAIESEGSLKAAYRMFRGRVGYAQEVTDLAKTGQRLLKSGKSPEEVARALHSARRNIGIRYKNMTPSSKLAQIYARNIERYGDPLGPSIDYLRSRGRSWEDIIESAARTGGADLGF